MTLYQGKNLFSGTTTGSGTGIGTTLAWRISETHREPSGVGYNPANQTLFTSDDDRDRIYMARPGADGVHGTSDDSVTSFSTTTFGSTDAEGVEYDPASGHLFVSDGTGIEVYDIDPVNGVFGDGDDSVTHFDVAQYGSRDAEGIGIDPQRNLLLVVDPSTKSIYEVTKAGALVRIIDCRGIPGTNRLYAGVTMAPSSDPNDSSSKLNYWIVDRQVDNGADPNENDGKLYEVAAPSGDTPPPDAPPAVTLTAPSEGATVSGIVTVAASASDDVGVTQVAFSVDGSSIGMDTNGGDGWSAPWNTTLATDGPHTVTARVTDTSGQTATDSNAVVVDNFDAVPTVSVTSPAEGATVSGTVLVQASASDDVGVTQVAFSVDGEAIGTDTNGADGWSASWDTRPALDGAHTVTATATDTRGQTRTDSNAVTVDNTPPVAAIRSPLTGATVSGTIPVEATASDNQTVASVQFFVDGSSIGTDTSATGGWSVSWNTTTVSDGAHTLTATARDGAGNATTSAPVAVSVDNPDIVVLDVPVAIGTDDAHEWADGTISRTGGDLELGSDQLNGATVATTLGARFTGITVPRGATITRAYVQFQADEKGRNAASLTVRAQASDNAAGFATTTFGISSRPRTNASAGWAVPVWTAGSAGEAQRTPDLSSVLQEVVNRPGWAAGNAAVVIITGTGRRTAESFEGGPRPVLHVEYARP
ncbi:MAG TPA: Ig-like domain-containing protein [Gaiellaceae bacterium]|nr:Ig-like domain-containing protein [Gaiellaceae bacterium]